MGVDGISAWVQLVMDGIGSVVYIISSTEYWGALG